MSNNTERRALRLRQKAARKAWREGERIRKYEAEQRRRRGER